MEREPTIQFTLVADVAPNDALSTTLASLRRQSDGNWTAHVIGTLGFDDDSFRKMTGGNPRITSERTGVRGRFSTPHTDYEVFVPLGAELQDDAVEYLRQRAIESQASLICGWSYEEAQRGYKVSPVDLVMFARNPSLIHGPALFVYERSLLRTVINSPRFTSEPAVVGLDSTIDTSVRDVLASKTKYIHDMEHQFMQSREENVRLRAHLSNIEQANSDLALANDALHTANNQLNTINERLLRRLAALRARRRRRPWLRDEM